MVTPEVTYIDYSISSYGYRRTSSQGATLLTVEICLKEIRSVSAQFATADVGQIQTPKDVGAYPALDNGKVQAQPPNVSTLKSIVNKIPGLFQSATDLLRGRQ